MKQVELTPSQARALFSSLYLFERSLRRVDQILSDGDKSGITYSKRSRLDRHSKELIKQKIALTLLEIKQFTEDLGFCPVEENLENEMMAELSISWENLEESRSKRMRGYGALSPQTIKIIDPVIDHFAQVAIDLSRMISTHPQEEYPGKS